MTSKGIFLLRVIETTMNNLYRPFNTIVHTSTVSKLLPFIKIPFNGPI